MRPFENISLAFSSVKTGLTRTIITCCIIAFGIMALVGILTAIDGLKAYINKDFSSMGANTFKVRNMATGVQMRGSEPLKVYRRITLREALDFQRLYDYPWPVSVQTIANFTSVLKYEGKESNPNITIFGSDRQYMRTEGFELLSGRNFSDDELSKEAPSPSSARKWPGGCLAATTVQTAGSLPSTTGDTG